MIDVESPRVTENRLAALESAMEMIAELPCYGQWFWNTDDPEPEDCMDYLSEQCPACKLKTALNHQEQSDG